MDMNELNSYSVGELQSLLQSFDQAGDDVSMQPAIEKRDLVTRLLVPHRVVVVPSIVERSSITECGTRCGTRYIHHTVDRALSLVLDSQTNPTTMVLYTLYTLYTLNTLFPYPTL